MERAELSTRSFDAQAGSFEHRAGLPAGIPERIATALVQWSEDGPGEVLLEVGAVTEQIGFALCRLPLRYVGFDASAAMLDVFRRRAGSRTVSLIYADGNYRWPIAEGSVRAVFSSRAVHLLPLDHVVAE